MDALYSQHRAFEPASLEHSHSISDDESRNERSRLVYIGHLSKVVDKRPKDFSQYHFNC